MRATPISSNALTRMDIMRVGNAAAEPAATRAIMNARYSKCLSIQRVKVWGYRTSTRCDRHSQQSTAATFNVHRAANSAIAGITCSGDAEVEGEVQAAMEDPKAKTTPITISFGQYRRES